MLTNSNPTFKLNQILLKLVRLLQKKIDKFILSFNQIHIS